MDKSTAIKIAKSYIELIRQKYQIENVILFSLSTFQETDPIVTEILKSGIELKKVAM